ncbi:MAG: FK506-binding protein [SAR116 cluster bacterium MED-G04]|nr:MAG: FK506-binding protein [SAR116 cluster bacterium MED-G04]
MIRFTLPVLFLAGLFTLTSFSTMEHAMADELTIEILEQGEGEVAADGMRVTVHYEGRLVDGTVFDTSYSRNQPFDFILGGGQVIRGWEEGVSGMKIGEKRRLTIPPELGYGSNGAGDVIPPDATLVFEVELLGVTEVASLAEAGPDELKKALEDGTIIVDIRREDEWRETGIIEGAHTVTAFTADGRLHPEFQEKFFSLMSGPEARVLLYCQVGGRSNNLGNALINQLGFNNISHLSEGIAGWLDNDNPVVPFTE